MLNINGIHKTGKYMAIGKSDRVIVEIDPKLKEELHAKLKANGFNMKEWFEKKVAQDYPELIQPK